ncbi:MAG: class A beta-lactamase-related serine hydrolase [Bryobacteraceae bacterium]|nr:class A beta-lactamase-related serine hydrolase [Bryobacteraceae bacterium]
MRLFVFSLLLAAQLAGQTASELFEQKLMTRLRALDNQLDGVLGVAVIDLTTGQSFSFHGDTIFPQASSIKIPIMAEMYRAERAGEFRFSDPVTLEPKAYVGGSGELQKGLLKGPVKTTIGKLVTAMIEESDNTATNWCIAKLGMARVNRLLDELNLVNTRLRRIMLDTAAASRNEENVSTPKEMARLVEMIYRQQLVDPSASMDMRNMMGLVKADFRKSVPLGVDVASKPGEVTGVRCETGIIFLPGRPFVLSVMSSFVVGEDNPVPAVARLVFNHFERLANGNRFGNLGTR